MNQQLRIYLAWQRIADGRAQIRRWSPDRFANAAQSKYMFLGFEAQSAQATAWLSANGEPTYPECFDADLPDEPYMIQSDGAYKAWEPKKLALEMLVRNPDMGAYEVSQRIDENMSFLKTNKGEK